MLVKSRFWRLFLILAVFALVGPPIGGLVAWMSIGAFELKSPLPFLAGSYGEGLSLALGSGFLAGFAALWLAMRSWLVPVVASLASNAISFVLTAEMDMSRADYLAAVVNMGRVFLPPSLVAALVCWFLVRPLLGVSQGSVNSGA